MSLKRNSLRSELPENKSKEESKPVDKAEKKVRREKKASGDDNAFILVGDFFRDKKLHFFIGSFTVMLSFYLLFAFTSFLFTWKSDFSEVSKPVGAFFGSDAQAANWLGKVGALISHVFINNGFGISSFTFVLLAFVTGLKVMLGLEIMPLRKTYTYSSFILVFTSLLCGFCFDLRWLGGSFGYFSTLWLNTQLGQVGTGLLLFFSALTFVVLAFNIPFERKYVESKESSEPTTEEIKNENKAVPVPEQSVPIEKNIANRVNNQIIREPSVVNKIDIPEPYIIKKNPSFEVNNAPEVPVQNITTPTTAVIEEEIEENENPHPAAIEKSSAFETLLNSLPGEEETVEETESEEDEEELDIDELEEDEDFEEDDDDEEDLEEDEDEERSDEDEDIEENPAQDKFEVISRAPESSVPLAIEPVKQEDLPLADDLIINNIPEGEYDPKLDLSSYQYPGLDLLENYGTSNKVHADREELEENKNRIVETFGHYNIDIDKIKATIGPTVTLYEIVPKAGVRISKIKNLEDDIALSLAALGIRIIAPIPGKGTIGIEVPNSKPEMVAMKSILASERFQLTDMDLPIALGKTISNEVFVADLAKMPHLLMAGATGQGKSVGLNAILVSLLYKKHPSQVKFVLVDPKKVELTLFKKIERHFLAKLPGEEEAIITDTKKVINTLNSLCIEMDQRYDLLKNAQVRNIKEYNAKFVARRLNPNNGHRFLPYIVLVVDEFADLIMTAGKEVEMPIARLAQLARAIGIHLIIATQRPSVNIITGTIKANFPARIAFRVTSKIDSRTILDAGGADQLIGRGDMLLSTGADLIRIQCAFVDTPEVEKITDFIGSQRAYASAFLLPEYVDEKSEGNTEFNAADRDAYFEEAARIIVQNQQGSASLLQRRLKLGYNRAGRIIDQLEAAGIIGSFEGSKAREVLIPTEQQLEEYLNKIK